MSEWIDAHAHWAQVFPEGTSVSSVTEAIESLRSQGMRASIQAGVDPDDWERQLKLFETYPTWIRPVLGLHPWWVRDHSEEQCAEALSRLERLLREKASQVVAVGELGLDFSKDGKQSKARQRDVFERQLELARRTQKPLVLHIVQAHDDALQILALHADRAGRPLQGLVHAFSGAIELARRYTGLGLKLSIGPGISQPGRFLTLKKTLPLLGPQDWVLESDAAGEHFFRVVQAASGLTGRSSAELARQTLENLQQAGFS